jgi:3-methyladenine DNA glycosylase/8-oxoguanine DNA glycosylase
MSDKEIDDLLDVIRVRRKQKLVIYKEEQEHKERLTRAKLEVHYEKACEQIERRAEMLDKALENFERSVNKLRALRLELGDTL